MTALLQPDQSTEEVSAADTAAVIPFPIARRVRYIAAQRKRAATFPYRREAYLRGLVEKYRERLSQIGVPPELIVAEIRQMETMLFGSDEKAQG